MGSNLASTARNVYSKKMMNKDVKSSIDSVSLLTVVNLFACLMLLPLAIFTEGERLMTDIAMGAIDLRQVGELALVSACLLQFYQQVSYYILSKLSAVTHAVANCLKRVVVIVAAVVFFQHPVSPLNAAGTVMALAGVFWYSQVKVGETEAAKLRTHTG
eukprot:scaffold2045_cov404-Prasinococcus_capsulatus_cf.AAC.66